MGSVKFKYYDQSEFAEYLAALPKGDAQKLVQTILLIEKYGLETAKRMQWVKKLERNLYEIRSKFGSNIQRVIYFKAYEDGFIITHGFTKKTDRTPEREKRRGRQLRKFYLEHGDDRK